VEPSGFTKVSALGVEEQRVNVVMDFAPNAGACAQLGDAFRVEVRVVAWEGRDLVKVPTSALFRVRERWAAYVLDENRARLAMLDIGQRNDEEAEVRAGLTVGQTVVLHPGDRLRDGTRIFVRAP
jgi:HlyD family secretion protein